MASPVSVLVAAVLVLLLSFAPFSVVGTYLSSPLNLEISTISAAPALLPGVPTSSPSLSPDITPRLPSPKPGDAVSPSGSSLPTIPSSRSPPNPDADAAAGPAFGVAPAGAFSAMAASGSAVSLITLPVSTALFWLSSMFLLMNN